MAIYDIDTSGQAECGEAHCITLIGYNLHDPDVTAVPGAGQPWGGRWRALLAAALLAAPSGRCTCTGPSAQPEDSGLDAGVDARADRTEWPPFADATPRDAYQPGPFPDAEPCDATFIELPPNGSSFISMVSNQGPWVAYDYRPAGASTWPDIFLYNLETCTEHRITYDQQHMDWQPWFWNGMVVWGSQLDAADHYSLQRYDLASGAVSDLWQATGVSVMGAVADHVVYSATPPDDPSARQDMYWLRLQASTATLLETAEDGAGSGGDMSETFFTWPSLMNNENAGIWVVELATGRKIKLPGSLYGSYPTTGGEWFVWQDWRSGQPAIWGVRWSAVYDPVHVTDNGAVNGFPRLRGHLLCFRTTLWSGGGSAGWDIAVMDMDTWVVRRVTPAPWPSLRCEHADGDWVVFRWDTTQWGYSRIYAFNLRRNGLLGPDGHLVPE